MLEGDLIRERFGQPQLPSVRSRTALAFCLSWQGEFTEAITLIQEATYIAEAADHQGSVVNALQSAGLVYALKGDYDGRRACVFRAKAATDSTAKLPPIPRESCH
jgi:hypothetical protein